MRNLISATAVTAICAVTALAQRPPAASIPTGGVLVFFSSEGQDPFRLVAQKKGSAGFIPRDEALHYGSLEATSNGLEFIAASWDELYRIDPHNGARSLLGKVRAEHTFRAWFSHLTTYANVALPGPTTVEWVLRATVEAPNVGTSGFFHFIDENGITIVSGSSVDELYHDQIPIPNSGILYYTIYWFWDAPSYPQVHISISAYGAHGPIYHYGMFGAESDAFDVGLDDATLPLAGISMAPDNRLIGLSQGDWDVHGGPGLYELFIESNGVRAVHLCQPDVPLTAIEFLDDGTLIGAGASLYDVDPVSGVSLEIGTTGLEAITDMDHAPDGVLYGVTLPMEGDSQLVELISSGTPQPPRLLNPPGRHWGLAVRIRDQIVEPAIPLSFPVNKRSGR